MKQLKIIEKSHYDKDLSKCITNVVILSSDTIEGSITVKFHLVDKDKLKFIVGYEDEEFSYENTFNFTDTDNMLKEIINKIKEVFSLIEITIIESDFNTISEMLLKLINGCKNMNGVHVIDEYFKGKDACFTILPESQDYSKDERYFYVEIKNHGWKKENTNDWMFNMEHHNPNEIMDAYAEYEDDKVVWYISNSVDNIEFSDLIDYIMEEFNNPTLIIKPDKTIILDFKLELDY